MLSRQVMRGGARVFTAAVVAVCVSVFAVEAVSAQAAGDTGVMRGRVGGGGGRGAGGIGRPRLDEFKAFYEKSLKDRVTLTDEQIVKWRAWNTRFDPDRRAMWKEEGELRSALRQQLARGVVPDEAKVAEVMERFAKLERNRLALKERENKELATFMKPIQFARFFVFQDQVQREMQEMDRRRDGGRGDGMNRDGGGRGGPPMRGDSAVLKFRQGMRGDSAGGKFSRPGMRPPGKVDTLSDAKLPKN